MRTLRTSTRTRAANTPDPDSVSRPRHSHRHDPCLNATVVPWRPHRSHESDLPHPRTPRTPRTYNPCVSVPRFVAPSLDPGDETVVLPREEGEHLVRVLRLGVGDTVA